jgi:hypothetical protein
MAGLNVVSSLGLATTPKGANMQLACDSVVPGLGCEYVATGHSADATHAAMMAHGGDAHANLMEGKTDTEMMQMKEKMDADIRRLIDHHN